MLIWARFRCHGYMMHVCYMCLCVWVSGIEMAERLHCVWCARTQMKWDLPPGHIDPNRRWFRWKASRLMMVSFQCFAIDIGKRVAGRNGSARGGSLACWDGRLAWASQPAWCSTSTIGGSRGGKWNEKFIIYFDSIYQPSNVGFEQTKLMAPLHCGSEGKVMRHDLSRVSEMGWNVTKWWNALNTSIRNYV